VSAARARERYTAATMALQVAAGHASRTGPRDHNEDFCGYVTPAGSALASKGVLLAVADGVSGSSGGRESAEYAVRGLLGDYYATPDTWTVTHALDRVINAVNQWLVSQARGHDGLQTTLSALVLRGRWFHVAHVGDSRIYLLRGGRLRRLTVDHVWDRPEMQHVLTRALGLDGRLLLDHGEEALEPGDRFALVSDGVWEPLGDRELERLLAAEPDPEKAAMTLVDEALARGGQDNATAVVARIDALPESVLGDVIGAARDLAPLPRRLRPGERIDDFEVLELLHESRETLLYKVRDTRHGGVPAVLKTLPPTLAQDAERRDLLLAEEWLARRLVSHYFPQALPLDGRRSALYYATTYHEGATLEQNLAAGRHFSVTDVVGTGIRLLKGLSALHRRDVVHCDVKPANLHLGADGRLRILDFGVARSVALQREAAAGAGTPSFMAPELLAGSPPDAGTDLYAAGVTLYRLLTRKYPYGEIEPFQRPRFGDPVPPARYRPDIPGWLDALLRKAVARDKAQRFETAEEFLLALERGEREPLAAPPRTPLADRNPLLLWRSIAVSAIVLNLLLFYLLVVR
jgi:serine/threonine protein phosphatase PrpC